MSLDVEEHSRSSAVTEATSVSMEFVIKPKVFNPESLCRLSARAVNKEISSEFDLDTLSLPMTLKEYLKNYWMNDRLFSTEKLAPLELEDIWFDFGEPWVECGTDLFLTIMRWPYSYGVPCFAYEYTVLNTVWYDITHENRKALDRVCQQCVVYHYKRMEDAGLQNYMEITKMFERDWCYGCDLISELQDSKMWCSECHTRNLVYISGAPCKLRRSIYQQDELAHYEFELVDGKWRSI